MQARELSEGEEQSRISFEAGQQPAIVAQPGDGPFDFPALTIAFQHASVLSGMSLAAAFAMRTDELDAILGKSIPQRITVRSAIVNQSRRVLVQDMIVEQRLDQSHFGGAGAVEIDRQRQAPAVDEQHQLATLASFRRANACAPFFAGINVASAIATFQSTRPFRSSRCSTRRQASSKTPLSIHSTSRRQQVV